MCVCKASYFWHPQKQIISNLQAVLTQAGSNLENILKVTIFLTDMNDFTVMNEAYKFLLPDPKPVGRE